MVQHDASATIALLNRATALTNVESDYAARLAHDLYHHASHDQIIEFFGGRHAFTTGLNDHTSWCVNLEGANKRQCPHAPVFREGEGTQAPH